MPGPLGPLLLISCRFEGGLFQKIFKGYIFCFLGHLVGGCIFELNTHGTNLMKKRSVSLFGPKLHNCNHANRIRVAKVAEFQENLRYRTSFG